MLGCVPERSGEWRWFNGSLVAVPVRIFGVTVNTSSLWVRCQVHAEYSVTHAERILCIHPQGNVRYKKEINLVYILSI